MAIVPLTINRTSLEPFSMLIHGDYGTFKTYLLGSMLLYYMRLGKTVCYWSVKGEENHKTLVNFPELLDANVLWRLETYADVEEAYQKLEASPVYALAVDQLVAVNDMVAVKEVGEDRLPRAPKLGQKGENESIGQWVNIHWATKRRAQRLRGCATVTVAACPSDVSRDHLDLAPGLSSASKKTIAPALLGKEGTECTGWFDFVAYCKVRSTGPGTFLRELSFLKSETQPVVVRANTVIPFSSDIGVPAGPGCWEAVRREMEKHVVVNPNPSGGK